MQHQVETVVLVPSLYCSQACPHCCRAAGPQRRERMSEDVARKTARLLDQWSFETVTISGGEPLLMSKVLWQRVLDLLPHNLFTIHMVSNGDWLTQPRYYQLALHFVLPQLVRKLHEYPDGGLCIELSGDQYHSRYDKRRWQSFKYAVQEPYDEATDDDDPICELLGAPIHLSERDFPIVHVIPTGRAHDWGGERATYEDCGIDADLTEQDDDYLAHTITIYPDGAVKACCNGGPTIGHVREDGDALLDRHAQFVRTMRQRYGHDHHDSVDTHACTHCAHVARTLYRRTA